MQQAPTEASFTLAARRASRLACHQEATAGLTGVLIEEDAEAALVALEAARAVPLPPSPDISAVDKTALTADNSDILNETYGTTNTTATATSSKSASNTKGIMKKKKPVLSAKEKKERGVVIDKVVSALPLEFRGNDPNLRRQIEIVIDKFLSHPDRGIASTPGSLREPRFL